MNKKSFSFFLLPFSFFLFFASSSPAVEGMWLPLLLKQLNETEMKSMGLKLSADDIYNINQSSLKDAIVSFGGFCTGELISTDGLILTNHHCGIGYIQNHSSVENDYLKNGFWAKDRNQELPNKDLFVTFIVRMENVTDRVRVNINASASMQEIEKIVQENSKKIIREVEKDSEYKALIKSFFHSNEYYLFVTQTFKDIRLVGAPPQSIGNFGKETDNWIWPRHTADFSLFRIYADKNNKPAEYSPDNVPYHPRHHLPISLKGIKEGDFTMVYGFPGRSNEYLTSYGVNYSIEKINPQRIKIREEKLKIMDADMKKNDKIRIQYTAKYSSVANGYKKWIGETRGLKKVKAMEKKIASEKEFHVWVNSDTLYKRKYSGLISAYKEVYQDMEFKDKFKDYYYEAIKGIELFSFSLSHNPLLDSLKNTSLPQSELQLLKNSYTENANETFKDYNPDTDKKLFVKMLTLFKENIPEKFYPEYFKNIAKKYKYDFDKMSNNIYSKSVFADSLTYILFLQNLTSKKIKKLQNDPAYKLAQSFYLYYTENFESPLLKNYKRIDSLNVIYMKGLMTMNPDKRWYPDANSTLRLSYGKVEGYTPFNGAQYNYYSTLDGVIEKGNFGLYDYDYPPRLKELYDKKDFGRYAENGKMVTCFIASNHTTGGNSGSPVLNAEGHLIGLNFDRTWESTMSDIMYNPDVCRNVAADIRYILFIIDKYAGADTIIKELTLID